MEDYCSYCTDWVSNTGKCLKMDVAKNPPHCFYLDTVKLVEKFILVQKKIDLMRPIR